MKEASLISPDPLRGLRDRRSRRGFIGLAGATGLGAPALILAACGGGSKDPNEADAEAGKKGDPENDVAVLNALLDLEFTAVAAYQAIRERLLELKLSDTDAFKVARRLYGHEVEHANAISQAVQDLGGKPNKPKSEAEYDKGFPALRTRKDTLELGLDLERTAIAAYIDALPRLSSGQLRATAGAIVTSEAEHVSVVLGALGRAQLPDALPGREALATQGAPR
jgi:bacterioferritin (cytochrome b1)